MADQERPPPLYIKNQRSFRLIGCNFSGAGSSACVEFYGENEDISIIGARFSNDNGIPTGGGLRIKGTLRGLTMAAVHVESDAFYAEDPQIIRAADPDLVERLRVIGLDPQYARGNVMHLASQSITMGQANLTLSSGNEHFLGDRGASENSAREPFVSSPRPVAGRITMWRAICSRGPGGGQSVTFELRVNGSTVATQQVTGTGIPRFEDQVVSIAYDAEDIITVHAESSPGSLLLGTGASVWVYEGG